MEKSNWWKEFLPSSINESEEEVSKLLEIEVESVHYCKELRYFWIDSDSDFKQEKKNMNQVLNGKDYSKDKWQWSVILSGNPDRKFYDEFVSEIKGTVHFNHNNSVHRGHYLASVFKTYLVPEDILLSNKDKDKVSRYFGKGNDDNIYYQSVAANCNSAVVRGQLYFEQKIDNFLKDKDEKKKVVFQIQDCRENDTISEGRRILGIFLENGEILSKDSFHVYIPNGYGK